MLADHLFTLVAGFFVLLRVISDNTIPTLPDGVLLPVGISNREYLTAKFVPDKR
jgi:hypothetical protein